MARNRDLASEGPLIPVELFLRYALFATLDTPDLADEGHRLRRIPQRQDVAASAAFLADRFASTNRRPPAPFVQGLSRRGDERAFLRRGLPTLPADLREITPDC